MNSLHTAAYIGWVITVLHLKRERFMHIVTHSFQTTHCHLSCLKPKRSKFKTFIVQLACLTFFFIVQPTNATVGEKEPAPKDPEAFSLLGETWIAQPEQSVEDLNGQLLVALGNDNILEVKQFLDSGAEVNVANTQGMTPIMGAQSVQVAQLLLERGANPKAIDTDGGSVIHYAVTQSNAPELIHLFASKGVDPNLRGWEKVPAIFIASDFFYETKAFQQPINTGNESNMSSPKDVLKALVDVGADLNATDNYGNTLLMDATVQNNAEMVKLLLELGADKSIKKVGSNTTAKDIAYDMGRRYIFQLLD